MSTITRRKLFQGANAITASITTTGQIDGDSGCGGLVSVSLTETCGGNVEFHEETSSCGDPTLEITARGGTEYQTLMEAFLWLGSQMVELSDRHVIDQKVMFQSVNLKEGSMFHEHLNP